MFNNNNKDLKTFKKNITNIVIFFLSISIMATILLFISIIYINKYKSLKTFQELVVNTNKILQFNLASQLRVIANDPNFINYLYSYSGNRRKQSLNIKWLFSNFNPDLIKGMEIRKNQNLLVFTYGNETNFFTTVYLCYLNNKVNLKFGDCRYTFKIYFDKNAYINQLNILEPTIVAANKSSNTYWFDPFNDLFGNLQSLEHSNQKLQILVNYKFQSFLVVSIAIITLILFSIFILSYRYLKLIIQTNLVDPIQYIIDSLHSNNNLPPKNLLKELDELMKLVNEHNQQQLNIKLNTIAAGVAHDLNGPINGIQIILKKIKTNSGLTPELKLLEIYVNRIYLISSDLLQYFRRNSGEVNLLADNLAPLFVLVTDIIDEVIQYNDGWKQQAKFTIIKNDAVWVFASPIKLYRIFTNLIKNSIESLKLQTREIQIIFIIKHPFVVVTIKDTGIGIPAHEINNVLHGKSLKHVGQGLGLSSAVQYIKELGGDLLLESTVNVGTILTIKLPQTVPSWISSQIYINPLSQLVIIEDNLNLITFWQKFLLLIDNKKIYFADISAIKKFISSINDIDLIIIINKNYYLETALNDFLTMQENVYIVPTAITDYEVQISLKRSSHKILPASTLENIKIEYSNF